MASSFATSILGSAVPERVRADISLPRRQRFHPSPADWRDEVLYFLLVDRFSDAQESSRSRLDRNQRDSARPPGSDGQDWRWDRWAESGAHRWQGGTIQGVASKLDYLQQLGISTIWISPVFKQRGHLDTFHGYGIQHFLDVDPHFGTRQDLVDLVDAAHQRDMRIILDIIFNHSGFNWVYPGGVNEPPFKDFPHHYGFGSWLGRSGEQVEQESLNVVASFRPTEIQQQHPDLRVAAVGGGGRSVSARVAGEFAVDGDRRRRRRGRQPVEDGPAPEAAASPAPPPRCEAPAEGGERGRRRHGC